MVEHSGDHLDRIECNPRIWCSRKSSAALSTMTCRSRATCSSSFSFSFSVEPPPCNARPSVLEVGGSSECTLPVHRTSKLSTTMTKADGTDTPGRLFNNAQCSRHECLSSRCAYQRPKMHAGRSIGSHNQNGRSRSVHSHSCRRPRQACISFANRNGALCR